MNAPGNIELSFEYDGLLAIAEEWSGPVQGRIERTYNNNFWVSEESVDGRSIAFSYNADGLLTGTGSLSLERDPAHGLIVGSGFGDISGTRGYNAFGELMAREIQINEVDTYSVTYTRDALGRIGTLTETIAGITSEKTYHYDPAGRLVQVDRDGITTHTYSYDANSNRIEHSGPAGTIDADYDEQDRMLRYGDSFYTYNEAGDLTDKTGPEGTSTYDYDAAGNLRAVTPPDGTQIEYLIDGRDRRVGKKVNGRLEKTWIYRDQLSPVAQFDGDGNLTHRFVYAEQFHVPSYMVEIDLVTGEEAEYRIVFDHLGSVRQVIDAETGAIVQEMEYGPFGQVISDTNPGFQPFGFAGGVYDRDTGLVRFGARDYDPVTGRWTAKDPIDFAGGGSNLFGYIWGDPVSYIDPRGTHPFLNSAGRVWVMVKTYQDMVFSANAGPAGSMFVGVVGFSGSTGFSVDTNLDVLCSVSTLCVQCGLGFFGGAGVEVAGGINGPLSSGTADSFGFFGNLAPTGGGPAGGGSINFGEGYVGGTRGIVGGGVGASGGVQFCRTYTACPGD